MPVKQFGSVALQSPIRCYIRLYKYQLQYLIGRLSGVTGHIVTQVGGLVHSIGRSALLAADVRWCERLNLGKMRFSPLDR